MTRYKFSYSGPTEHAPGLSNLDALVGKEGLSGAHRDAVVDICCQLGRAADLDLVLCGRGADVRA